jgi:cytochrome bd ubiquinol oxidase subunit I
MYPYYPIQDYGPIMKGMVIGGLGIIHVFLAQMAIGGGMLLCYFEWLRRTGRTKNAGRFVNGYFQALVLVSFVLGALTGVAMWFLSIEVSPRTIGVMVDEFHWLWATEWTIFCVEVVSGYTFLRFKDRLSGRGRMLLLVIYSVAAWFSLFWINGILSFQLTPGRWVVTHNVWPGFFNPSFWPTLLYRTVAAMAIATLAACVVINVSRALEREAQRELIGHASLFLAPMVLMPFLGLWFLASMPADSRSWVIGRSVIMTMFMGIGIAGSLLLGIYGLGAFWYKRLYMSGFAAALLCAIAFAATAGGEFVRAGVRKPYSIRQVLDSNSLRPDELVRLRESGSVADLPNPLRDGLTYPNVRAAVMTTLFPFGFPWPTAMYLTLFIVTAAIDMVFMNYVLAGAIVLLISYLAPGARRRLGTGPIENVRSGLGMISKVVRDWLPAILGLAITAGIAPLLFVQILYKHLFYTANLLLFNRFVLLLPVFIVAYCMLYLVKSHALAGRWAILRGPAMIVAFGCFFFTAWAWTENHVLSLHREEWNTQLISHAYIYRNSEISPRLGYWITASFTTLAVAVAWQLHWGRRFHDPINLDLAARRLRSLAILGLAMSAAEAWLWVLWLDTSARAPLLSILALPYGMTALLGMAIQAGGWLPVKTATGLTTLRLTIISGGNAMTLIGALVVREARRLAAIDITGLFDTHRQAAQVGGMGVFLVFFAINAAVVTACVLIVKRALRPLN